MRFRGTVESAGGGGAFVRLPFDPRQAFGKARAPVRGSVNGAPFRSTVAIYGGAAFLGLPKSLRAAAAADVGDEVQVEIERDEEPREVEVPPELAAALRGDAQATEAFNELSYTHRRHYARWGGEANAPE